MASEVIDWDISITIDGVAIATQQLSAGVPTAVGPVTVTVSNGTDVGDVRSGSATLTVAEYGSATPRTFIRGHEVSIEASIGGRETVRLYAGFIGESVMSQVSHHRLGDGVQTHITLIDMLDYVRSYGIDLADRFGGDIGIRFPALDDLTSNLIGLLRNRVPRIKHNGLQTSAWQRALTADMDYIEEGGSTIPAVDALGSGWLPSLLLVYIDPEKSYDVRGALELLGTVMLSRAAIQGDTITTKLARAFGGDVYTVPESCITGLSTVESRLSDYWDGVHATVRAAHERDSTVGFSSDWPIDDEAPGRTHRRYDWSDSLVDTRSRGNGNWTASLVRHMTYAPRNYWRATGLTVLLDQFGKTNGPETITNLLRSTFDVLDGQPALPTINVPTTSPLMRATGADVAGIIESAVLTIDPLSRATGSRAKLDVTLGPGDMRPGTNTTRYSGPRWADASYQWRQAPHTAFGDAFIQEPQP